MKMKTSTQPAAGSPSGRCHWLDWLRFLAAFLVMVGHLRGGHFADYADLAPRYHNPLIAGLFALTRLGAEWVILFFVLSGYLVGGRSLRRALDGNFRTLPYAIDRFTRIYVPLVPALLLTAGVVLFVGGHVSGGELLGNLAGMQGVYCGAFGGNAPLWSLAYEIWFYILCGAALALTARAGWRVRVFAWVALLASLILFTKLESVYLFCWLLGAAACVVEPALSRRARLLAGLGYIACGVTLSQLVRGSASVKLEWFHDHLPSLPVALLVLALGFMLLVRTVADWEPRSAGWQAVEKFGAIPASFSYTLYLVHFPLGAAWESVFPGRAAALDFKSLATFGLEMLFCMVVSWLLYFLFERNTGRVRQWLAARFLVRGTP